MENMNKFNIDISDKDNYLIIENELENFSFDEIDSEIFDIPSFEYDAALNNTFSDIDENLSKDDADFLNSSESSLITENQILTCLNFNESDNESLYSRSSNKSNTQIEKNAAKYPSVMKYVTLKRISAQLLSLEKISAGLPTALAVGILISIGTSHGFILSFDVSQTLKWCFEPDLNTEESNGSVSCMDFCNNSSKLIVGFSKGKICIFDSLNGKQLYCIRDAHSVNTAVLHVKFTSLPTTAICSDSGGSVFELNFKKTFGAREFQSRCLFSGSRGEVCTIEPLLHPYWNPSSTSLIVVALATLSKVIVITCWPHLKVLFTYPLLKDTSYPPLIAWQHFNVLRLSKKEVLDPLLYFAKENTILCYQLTLFSRHYLYFIPLSSIEVPYKLINLCMLTSQTGFFLDSQEQVHIFDMDNHKELEFWDVSKVNIVYNSSHFKGLATGGNVSPAMALVGKRACYTTVITQGSQVLLLGSKSVHVLVMRVWNERLDFLMRNELFRDALFLSKDMYEGTVTTVLGLPDKKETREKVVKQKMLSMLNIYLNNFLHCCPDSNDIDLIRNYFHFHLKLCIELYFLIHREDLIFETVWESCWDPLARQAFLECLEPHFASGHLKALPPLVTQNLINHLEERCLLKSLEICLLHIDPACLDVHQAMTVCWVHGLYDALLSISNRVLHDFMSPFEDLMSQLKCALEQGAEMSPHQIALGNKLLVYVSHCLMGLSYPFGELSDELKHKVQQDILLCLTQIHTRGAADSELPYPYLRLFIKFNAPDFFNVLSLAFESENANLNNLQKQRIIDILLDISDKENFQSFGPLFMFVARQIVLFNPKITVGQHVFAEILNFLVTTSQKQPESQQILFEFLNSGILTVSQEETLLSTGEKAKLYAVCEFIYKKRKRMDLWLKFLISNSNSNNLSRIFDCVEEAFKSNLISDVFLNEILKNIKYLLSINSQKSVEIVLKFASDKLDEIIRSLKYDPKLLYQFLNALLNQETKHISYKYLKHFHELYIDLLCQFDPDSVVKHLKQAESLDVPKILKICKSHNVLEATAYLLEQEGIFQEALKLLLQRYSFITKQFLEGLKTYDQMETTFFHVIQFCQRHSESEYFYALLNIILEIYQTNQDIEKQEALYKIIQQFIKSTVSFIHLPSVLEKIVKNTIYDKATMKNIRGFSEQTNYEITLYHCFIRTLQDSELKYFTQYHKLSASGYKIQVQQCNLCQKHIKSDEDLVFFSCNHEYHFQCLNYKSISCPICYDVKFLSFY